MMMMMMMWYIIDYNSSSDRESGFWGTKLICCTHSLTETVNFWILTIGTWSSYFVVPHSVGLSWVVACSGPRTAPCQTSGCWCSAAGKSFLAQSGGCFPLWWQTIHDVVSSTMKTYLLLKTFSNNLLVDMYCGHTWSYIIYYIIRIYLLCTIH